MVLVSMTSYPKRISNVATSIRLIFDKQSVKPDKLYLYLAIEEFPNKEQSLPKNLMPTIKKYPVELVWLEKNTYAHKSLEIFKTCPSDSLVFLLDDDVEYDMCLISKCIKAHQMYPNAIVCFNRYSKHLYNGKRIVYRQTGDYSKPRTDTHWCKQSLFPAKLFPKEVFRFEELRDQCSPICVETWYDPFIVKNNIPILHLNFNWGKDISPAINKKEGLVKYSHEIEENGYERRDNWLYNTLKAFPEIMEIYKKRFGYEAV